jgi:hypothetical protein
VATPAQIRQGYIANSENTPQAAIPHHNVAAGEGLFAFVKALAFVAITIVLTIAFIVMSLVAIGSIVSFLGGVFLR